MEKIKSLIKTSLIFFCCVLFSLDASAKEYNWFFKPKANHEQPLIFDGNTLADDYNCLYLGDKDDKVIYLTFDAGYENGNVEKTLDILYAHNAQAAFFILPALIKSNTELVVRMKNEGHLVCNHSYSHRNMAKITDYEAFCDEINRLEEVYREYTGCEMEKYFRPPEGSFSEQTLEFCMRMGQTPVFWSFAYKDWDNQHQKGEEEAYEKIMSNVHNGMVMLLHPTSGTNANILDRVLTSLTAQGYRFGSLHELNFYKNREIGSSLDLGDYKKSGIVYAENPSSAKQIALTFDDGPHPTQTDRILAVLSRYDIRATFFTVGSNAKEHPNVLRRVIAAGHEIGNHTYSHILLSERNTDEFFCDVIKNDEFLQEEFGIKTMLLRPPGGAYTAKAIDKSAALGYKYVLWAWRTDTRDWAGSSTDYIVSTVKSNVKGGDVLLFHDCVYGNSHTAEALEILIPYMMDKGYEFVTVSELFSSFETGTPKEQQMTRQK